MFKPVESNVSFPKMEEEILKFWNEEKLFEKSLKWREGCEEYVFYDGPPFATGLPHYGHFLPGTMKDIIPRYQTMKGKYVPRRFGWDTHGLPVENEIEKKLGLKAKKDIEKFGIDKFNEECRSIVLRYVSEWESSVNRLGRWVDFKNAYKTMDLNYMESILWVFKTLWDKGLIYESDRVLPYCPRCATPLSNFEVNQGYKEVADPAITVKFKIKDKPNTYIIAWTTTPWTLPSNMALAVGEDITYVEIEDGTDTYILAKERLSHYYKNPDEYKIKKELIGCDLKGISYEPLFPYFPDAENEGAYKVVIGDFVTTEDGTGIVHIAPGFGEDDSRIGRENNLPSVCPIDEEGKFLKEIKDYAGLFVKDTDKQIIKDLKESNRVVKHDQYTHNYPHCWRCESPLLYRAVSSWFVNVEKIKQDMLDANHKINWVPAHLKEGRFGKWLEGARDWAISRNRYWGTPLPVWTCDSCDERVCIGSVKELEEKSGEKVTDLHKHFVDKIKLDCPSCSGKMTRISQVLDCWFESGAMPYAQAHYPFENKDEFEKTFPADFIAESLDQTRGWFYTLVVLSAALFKNTSFKNVVCTGLVLAEDGKKMSKRLKNYPEVNQIFDSYGADALRIYLMNSALVKAEEMNFSERGVKEVTRMLQLPLWNSYSFFVTYANIDNWDPQKDMMGFDKINNPLDKWILSSTEKLVDEVTRQMDSYDLQRAIRPFLLFIDQLTNWYIRRSRRRFWKSDMDDEKKGAYSTLYRVLIRLVKVMAPFTPFRADASYLGLRTEEQPESVHLCDYPVSEEKMRDNDLEREMDLAMRTVSMGRALRGQHKIRVRQPLSEIHLITTDVKEKAVLKKLDTLVREELNVKQVIFNEKEEDLVTLSAKANYKELGSRLGKNMKTAAGLISAFTMDDIKTLQNGKSINIKDGDFSEDIGFKDILIDRKERDGLFVINDNTLTVALNAELNDELIQEGLAREIVHHVQNMRKSAGFEVTDRIKLGIGGDNRIGEVMDLFSDYIKNEVLAVDIVKIPEGESVSLEGVEGIFSVEKVS